MKNWFVILFTMTILLSSYAIAADSNPFKSSFTSEHEIVLLNHGLSALEERLQMIERAKKTIDVEYFIFNLDKSGKIFTQALLKKAREGVKVRMLLDFFMFKKDFSPFFAYEMEKNGVEVRYFNRKSALNLFSGQYRNHRKLLVVDAEEAITGGRNIGDEYFDMKEDFNFLDRDIGIKGEVVPSILETFNLVWNSQLSKRVDRAKKPEIRDSHYSQQRGGIDTARYQQDLKKWNQKVEEAQNFISNIDSLDDSSLNNAIRAKGKEELLLEYRGKCNNMSFNSEYPIIGIKNRKERIIKHEISRRIINAKESIIFDSPYFIVDDEAKEALETALTNKVKISLLTNSLNSTDAIYVYAAFDSLIKNWIEKGLEAYIYKGDLPEGYSTYTDQITHARFGVHAKSFVFDNKDVVIGTFNFDPRSADLNTEMTISCDDNPELAKVVTEDIQQRIKGSIYLDSNEKVDEVEFYKTGTLKKIAYYLLKVPANIFDYLL